MTWLLGLLIALGWGGVMASAAVGGHALGVWLVASGLLTVSSLAAGFASHRRQVRTQRAPGTVGVALLGATVGLVVTLVLGPEGTISWVFAGVLSCAGFRLGQELSRTHRPGCTCHHGGDGGGAHRPDGADLGSSAS